jgi:hypothetical protein
MALFQLVDGIFSVEKVVAQLGPKRSETRFSGRKRRFPAPNAIFRHRRVPPAAREAGGPKRSPPGRIAVAL